MSSLVRDRPSPASRQRSRPISVNSDWFLRLRNRLGLGHWALAPDELAHFALMEYSVTDIFSQTTLAQPFAVPTVLEARNSEFFFPAPTGIGTGYCVELDHNAMGDPLREILHVRLTYSMEHLRRVARLNGPTPTMRLAAARDAHLSRIRMQSGRPDYGSLMSGEVDS